VKGNKQLRWKNYVDRPALVLAFGNVDGGCSLRDVNEYMFYFISKIRKVANKDVKHKTKT
jgi:hypothetical protein